MNALPSPRSTAVFRRRFFPLLAAGAGLLALPLAGAAATFSLKTTYTFVPLTDGNQAYPSLIQGADGKLYGTNSTGGKNDHGTAFALDLNGGHFTVLSAFPDTSGGNQPQSGLLQARDGNFYGTTDLGGDNGTGIFYQLTPTGTLTELSSFNNGDPGANPNGSLFEGLDGRLYGTARYGGLDNFGTVFRAVVPTGTLTTIAEITGGLAGAYPESDLIQASDDNFYGTTYQGGTANNGTFFRVTPAGVYTALYSFTGDTDGGGPLRGVVQGTDGAFYGVATTGGAFDAGTIFRFTVSGTTATFTLLYTFDALLGDGTMPYGNLFQASDGNFYGTTYQGGTSMDGTIYRVTPSGAFTTLYDFTNGTDGGFPTGGLTEASDGKLYGTTAGQTGSAGTVFQVDLGLAAPLAQPFYALQTSANIGDTILVKGRYFVGTTAVKFYAGNAATVTATSVNVLSQSILSVVVPAGAQTGMIFVTNAGGTGATALPLTINAAAASPTPTPTPAPTPVQTPTVTVVTTDPVATKTGGNNGIFKLVRTGDKTAALTVLFKTKGTAVRGTDYNLVTQGETLATVTNSLTFPANTAKLKIKVVPVSSSVSGPDETAVLQLKAGSGYQVSSPKKATVEIAGNTGGS